MTAPLALASGSPRRKELLERLGFAVRVMPSEVDEAQWPGELPEDYVKRLARAKVLAAVRRIEATLYASDSEARRQFAHGPAILASRGDDGLRWVLGADTVVVLDDVIFGKPQDAQEAREMLSRLSGREHLVITAFCLYDLRRSREGIEAVRTVVRFKPLSRGEVDAYVSAGESMDKAGGYAVQGVGSYLVEALHGSYTNVVGLPLCQVVEMMEAMGARDVLPWEG
ncbi:MAG: septum formation protein Maf [Deltaproteobacteria bacterium]|nr:septum formation protein Maf [Deltaproteobacteria bacterium]